MADITICTNESCPQKDNCFRYCAMPLLENQYYDCFHYDYKKKVCDFFIEKVYPPDKEELN